MIYVILAGFLIPMKSGVVTVSPNYLEGGKINTLKVNAYNANFDKADTLKAWIKVDSAHHLEAESIKVLDYNHLELVFDLSYQFVQKDSFFEASLILDNELDGYSLLPGALSIGKPFDESLKLMTPASIDGIHETTGIKFPFRNILYETIRNTFFHVSIWMALFVLATVAAIYSILFLMRSKENLDARAYSFTSISLLYGILGLATGAVWAKFTWGSYWANDVRLNMAAVSVLLYLAYFIIRGSINDKDRAKRVAAALNIFAYVAMIPLLLVIPRLTDSLHPGVGGNPAFSGEDLDNTLRMVFYPAIIALILLGTWIAQLRARIIMIENKE